MGIRVLHLHSGNLYGGVETFLRTLARHREDDPGIRHEFAVCFQGRISAEIEAAGAKVHDLGEVRARRPWTVARARRALAALLRDNAYAAVVCHASWPHAILSPVVRKANLPIVYYLHGPLVNLEWVD